MVRVAVIGAGTRGHGFGELLLRLPELARVVAVAEPRDAYRASFAARHGLAAGATFRTWQEFVENPPACDAVVIATLDADHVGPAVACLNRGLHVLLEKPMATSLADCQAIEAAQRRSGAFVAVCHSLRYNKGFAQLKAVVDAGRIGRIMTLDHIEQVSYWHQAHSFVRGNWANEGRTTFMLMAKSCHDIDFMAYLVGVPCVRVASSGSLGYFRPDHAPAGAPTRCTDGCPVEATCAYSAYRQYVNAPRLDAWPASVVAPEHTREAHLEAIRTGPYGRCVFRCDNDVVDHQVVLLEFAGGITASFTMTAFTQAGGRRIRVHGTEGTVEFDEEKLTIRTFATGDEETRVFGREAGSHGGGDARVVRGWLDAIAARDPRQILTSAQESLRTHAIVFAAEKARREGRVVSLGAS